MYDRDQEFDDSDELREVQDASDNSVFTAGDVKDLTEFVSDAAELPGQPAKTGPNGALDARRLLEQVKEERALRKAVYDDLYFLDEDD